MTGDSNKSTNNANSLDDIGTVVDDTDDYDAYTDEDDGHMKKVDKKIIQLEATLTKKLNIKRNKVLKALDIICRGVGVDNGVVNGIVNDIGIAIHIEIGIDI